MLVYSLLRNIEYKKFIILDSFSAENQVTHNIHNKITQKFNIKDKHVISCSSGNKIYRPRQVESTVDIVLGTALIPQQNNNLSKSTNLGNLRLQVST